MNLSRDNIVALINETAEDLAAFRLVYSSTPSWPKGDAIEDDPVNIAVMDSSFNPPHTAHLAMAASDLPPQAKAEASTPASGGLDASGAYTARLLLFSVRNIEKKPKAGDATVLQRIEMTILLAQHLAALADQSTPGGVAVGLINEPTFVGKSRIIRRHLLEQPKQDVAATLLADHLTLTFLIGTDTLTRFFEPKFYPSGMETMLDRYFRSPPEGDGSLLVCARRGEGTENREVEDDVLAKPYAKSWYDRGRIRMLGSGKEGWEEVSSSRIRKAMLDGNSETIKAILPGEIAEYIRRENLYTTA